MGDAIRPDHYCKGKKYEPKDVIRDWGLNFNLGSTVKYIARAGEKDDIVQDLRKAKQFLEFEIEAIEVSRNGTRPVYDEDVNEELAVNLCDSCIYPSKGVCPSYGKDAEFSGGGIVKCKHYKKLEVKQGKAPKEVTITHEVDPAWFTDKEFERFLQEVFGGAGLVVVGETPDNAPEKGYCVEVHITGDLSPEDIVGSIVMGLSDCMEEEQRDESN